MQDCQIGDGMTDVASSPRCLDVTPSTLGIEFGESPGFMTITVGRMDAEFMRAVIECVFETCPPDDPVGCVSCETRMANIDVKIKEIRDTGTISAAIRMAADVIKMDKNNIYVTGYPSWWNEQEKCPDFSLVREVAPDDTVYLNTDFRKRMNQQTVALNKAVQE